MSISCSDAQRALRAGVPLGIGLANQGKRPTRFIVVGIVPDWIKKVRLRPLGEPAVTIQTPKGIYSYSAKKLIQIEELAR